MIRLAKPYIPEKVYEDIKAILESGHLIQGKFVKRFEEELAKYLNIPYVKVVSSGTAALHLSLMAMGIEPGDEVIVPAFSFPATANVVEVIGATPVFVDINLSDYCINTSLIEEKTTHKTKAIIPVHEFGQPCDMDQTFQIAQKYKLKIIEDAACALGAEYKNQKVGTFGDIGCFSLHPRKAITTGEGGIVVTRNKDLADRIDMLRNHGIKKIDGKLDFHIAGLNYRMTEFQAAIGLHQLKIIEQLINKRIEQAKLYRDLLTNSEEVVLQEEFNNRKHIYQTFHILFKSLNRDLIIKNMQEKGFETNIGAYAIPYLDYYYNKYNTNAEEYTNAFIAFKQGLSLPIGFHIDIRDQKRLIKQLISNLGI